MTMFSICTSIIEQTKLDETLAAWRAGETGFAPEIGVLGRTFWQCRQQPHVAWTLTEWQSERHHNKAAEQIMQVRRDDRVASAYFRPGLYFEIFCREYAAARYERDAGAPRGAFTVVCHGSVADAQDVAAWESAVADRLASAGAASRLLRARTFYNYYGRRQFVGILEWASEADYLADREAAGDPAAATIEERIYVGARPYELSAYIQYECAPLAMRADA